MTGHAVISGAGIAGPALAHQLAARGWRTTVIERFPQRRDEGQNIDVRGAAREVARRMGIEEDLRAANTGEIGMRFLTDDGSPAASFPMSAPGEIDGPTAEFEILRGELSRILIEHTRRQHRLPLRYPDHRPHRPRRPRHRHSRRRHGDRRRPGGDRRGPALPDAPVRHVRRRQRPRHVLRLRHPAPRGHRRPVVELAARPRFPRRAPATGQPRHHARPSDVRLRRPRSGSPPTRRPDRHPAPDLRRRRRCRAAHPRRSSTRVRRCTSPPSAR